MSFYKTERYTTTAKGEAMAQAIAERLPHGSGFNGDWCIRETTRGHLTVEMTYDIMDGESGMYCCYPTFRATIAPFAGQKQKWEVGRIMLLGASSHERRHWKYDDMDSYIGDTLHYALNDC